MKNWSRRKDRKYFGPILNILNCTVMYRSNRSLNIPPRAYPQFHVTSRADSTRGDKSWRRQAFMHSKRKIPDSWRAGWKAKACTNFVLYLKVFKNHLHYLWHVRVLSPDLLNHVYIHSFRSIIKATEKSPGGGGIWSPGMDLWWGIWTAFRPREGGIWTKIFQKFKCPGGCPGGMLKLQFDWYITHVQIPKLLENALSVADQNEIWFMPSPAHHAT